MHGESTSFLLSSASAAATPAGSSVHRPLEQGELQRRFEGPERFDYGGSISSGSSLRDPRPSSPPVRAALPRSSELLAPLPLPLSLDGIFWELLGSGVERCSVIAGRIRQVWPSAPTNSPVSYHELPPVPCVHSPPLNADLSGHAPSALGGDVGPDDATIIAAFRVGQAIESETARGRGIVSSGVEGFSSGHGTWSCL